jgi:hypothetical protein
VSESNRVEQNRLEINWVNSLGGALAAVSSALVLSTLGTAGTLIGAAMGSLVITVGGAVYAHSLRVARARLAASRTVLVRTRGGGLAEVRSGPDGSEGADGAEATEEEASPGRWRQLLRELPWKRIVVASAALFAVAMAAILAFELATGRPVSSYTGGTSDTDRGTSVPGLGGRDEAPPGGEEAPAPQEQQDEVEQDDQQPEPAPVEPTPTEAEPVEPAPTPAPVPPQETAP